MAVADRSLEREGRQSGGPALLRWVRNQPVGRLLILPALLYVILVTQAPFILTIWYSLQRWNLLRPDRRKFIGLENYENLLTRNQAFRDALMNTVVFIVAAVLSSLLLGLLYAELVNHRFPGRGIVRTMLITPFLVMPVAAGLTWKNMMLNPNFGVVNWFTRTALPGDLSPNWLGHFPEVSIIGVLVWRWAPFMMLLLLAGMQSISEEVREAVRVDGASAWQEFRDITFPHLYRFLQLGGLLGTVFIVQEIDPIYMMTKGGPGNATTTLPYLVFREAIEGLEIGSGAAIGVVVVILSIIVITLLLRTLDRIMRGL